MTPDTELKRIGQHHSFDADLAVELKSIDLAVLVHHFQYWIRHNAETGKNFHEDRTWTYQTLKDIAAHFPYWSYKQVERFINKLVDLEILVKGNFNTNAYDRTVWYAFKNEARFSISRNREIEIPKSPNRNPEIGTPIPDNNTDYKKKKKKKENPSIEFDYETNQFVNIQESDISDWKQLYPGVNIQTELGKMRQWLMDPNNPERDGNRTFITNWLNRSQKEASKAPKKPQSPETQKPKESENYMPYDSSIAYGILHRDGEEAYIEYLRESTDQKYYQNFKNGIYEKEYIQYCNKRKQ